MRWTSRTMARHDSVAVGNALRRKSIEKCSFSRLKPRIFACGAQAAGCAGESVEVSHARQIVASVREAWCVCADDESKNFHSTRPSHLACSARRH